MLQSLYKDKSLLFPLDEDVSKTYNRVFTVFGISVHKKVHCHEFFTLEKNLFWNLQKRKGGWKQKPQAAVKDYCTAEIICKDRK